MTTRGQIAGPESDSARPGWDMMEPKKWAKSREAWDWVAEVIRARAPESAACAALLDTRCVAERAKGMGGGFLRGG
jgi:hypothetical protein